MYLNLVEIAESLGVSERVVEGWMRQEGLPHTLERGRALFDRAQVVQWAAERGLAARAGFLAPEAAAFASGCKLAALLRAGGIWRDVPAAGVLEVLARVVAALPGATAPIRELLALRVRAPGGITWAPVGNGFALPHLATRIALGRESGAVALLFLESGLTCVERPVDAEPIRRLLFFVAPSPRAHLDLLARFGRLLSAAPSRAALAPARSDQELRAALAALDAETGPGPRAVP